MSGARSAAESQLFDHLRIVRRFWRWIGAGVLLVGVIAYVSEASKPVTYQATTDVRFVVPEVATSGSSARDSADLLGSTYASAATSEAFATRVRDAGAGGVTLRELRKRLTIATKAIPGFIQVTATDPTATGAAALTDLAAAQLVNLINQDQDRVAASVVAPLETQLTKIDASLAVTGLSDTERSELQQQRREIDRSVADAQQKVRATVVAPDPASVPRTPIAPNPVRRGLTMAVLAFVLTTEAFVLGRYLRGSLPLGDPAGELGRIVGAPVLELGAVRRRQPSTPVLPFVVQHLEGRPVVTVVQRNGEPTTLPGSLVADALSRAGSRVIVVDADLRSPLLHQDLHLPLSPGLVEVATGQERLNHAVHRSPTGSGAVVLSAGALEDNNSLALALLGSGPLQSLIERTGADTTVVLTNSATTLEDALLVVHQFPEAVMFAVDVRTARRADIIETVRVIRSIGGNIVGVLCVHSNGSAWTPPWTRRRRQADAVALAAELDAFHAASSASSASA